MTSETKKILIAAAAGLVAAALAYGGGRWQGHEEVQAVRADLEQTRTRLEAEHDETRQKLGDELEKARSSLMACDRRADQLDARRRIHLALTELTALNFGYAQKHLNAAGEMLAKVSGGNDALAELARDIDETELEPTSDLDASRDRLMRLAERFDELVPPK